MNLERSNQPQHVQYDLAGVLEAFEECPDILGPVTKLFREAYARDLQALRVAIDKEECEACAFLAHKIKGSASYFRAVHVNDLAAELEAKGERGNLEGAHALADKLGEALDSVSNGLQQVEHLLSARL